MKSEFFYGKTYRVILIGILVVCAILAGILTYNINELRKFLPVANLPFDENEWIKVNYARIYARGDGVAPNEQLLLTMNVTNKQIYPLRFDPQIYVSVGGVPVKSIENPQHTEFGSYITSELLPNDFFLADSGPNQIEVKLKISFMNGTFIKYQNATTTINVLSKSEKLQLEQNTYTVIGIIASSIFASFAVIFTAYQTIQLRNEKKQTLRAWVGHSGSKITIVNVINDKNEVKSYEDWKKLTDIEKAAFGDVGTELHLILKNFGTVPAVDVRSALYVHPDREPTREEIDSIEFGDPFIIMPQNESTARFFLQKDISQYFLNPALMSYVSLEIKYKSSNSDNERIHGLAFARKTSGYSITNTWDEKSIFTKFKLDKLNDKK